MTEEMIDKLIELGWAIQQPPKEYRIQLRELVPPDDDTVGGNDLIGLMLDCQYKGETLLFPFWAPTYLNDTANVLAANKNKARPRWEVEWENTIRLPMFPGE